MPRQVDVLVIGGGVAGICTAHFLAEQGRQVTVVEKDQVCAGSSYGNAGLVVPSHSVPLAEPGVIGRGLRWMFDPDSPFYIKWRWDRELLHWLWQFRKACTDSRVRQAMPLLRDLHLRSLQLYQALAEEQDFAFGHEGRLLLCKTERGLDEVREEAELMQEVGLEVEMVDAAGVKRLDAAVEFDCIGGAYYRQDAHLDPARFVRGLASRCTERGVEICEQTEVLGFYKEERNIKIVETTRGGFEAGEVVLCSGAWSPGLVEDLDLRLPIQPAKGYSITAHKPDPCPQIPFMLVEAKVGATPMGDKLRFAGTLELAGMDFSINRRRVAAIMNAVPQYVPAWSPGALELIEVWRGLRPCTPDGLPFLGRAGAYDNLTVAAGHAMIGLSLGPVTGMMTARLVQGEDPGFDLSLCRVDRFSL
jgi:D-amino-acid dehydrogenase